MDKYVAFIDILGFKNWLKDNDQYEANKYIKKYANIVRTEWQKADTTGLSCIVVSDCVVVFSEDTEKNKLSKMISLTKEICIKMFEGTATLMRAAICKGHFEQIPHSDDRNYYDNYYENVFVGQAYVDAFLLEEKPKIAGISLSKEVYKDVCNFFPAVESEVIPFDRNKETDSYYLIRFFTKEILYRSENMKQFVKQANSAEWLPHYYNIIYALLYKHSGDKDIINDIIAAIRDLDSKDSKNRNIKRFIRNAFSENVEEKFREQFTTYLSNELISNINRK